MEKKQKILLNILFVIAIVALWYWYSHPIFELAFKNDDTHSMRVALSHPWYAFLTQPFAYQELSTAHYTPWVLWSHQFDFFLAGDVNKYVFYGHQWLSITLLIGLLSLLAWRISGQMAAAIIALLLLITHPSLFRLLTENDTRHYVEGAILVCLSGFAALAWMESQKWFWWVLSVIFYAVSLLCKEIYLIVPFLYLWLPALQSRRTISLFGAWAVAIMAYFWFRGYMIGTPGGGMQGMDISSLLSTVKLGLPNFVEWFVQTSLALIIAVSIALSVKRLKMFIFFILSLILILMPAVFAPGVWLEPNAHANRVLILLYLFMALFSAVHLAHLFSRNLWKYMALAGLFVWAYYVGIQNHNYIKTEAKSASTVIANELLKQSSPYDALVVPSGFRLGELHWMNRYFRGHSVDLLLTEPEVVDQYLAGRRIGRFDEACGCIKLITKAPTQCQRQLGDEQFHTDFSYHHGLLSWSMTFSNMTGEAGIIFLDRHLIVPTPFYSARFSRPRQGENYRFYFIGLEGYCWFGPIKAID